MKHTKNIAFTLVELIVVITILAVLATVAFISFQGYTSSARDSVRLADLKNITKSFELMRTKDIQLPLPDKSVNIASSGTIFQYQGVLEEKTLQLSNIHNGGFDPLTGDPYGYAVNAERNKFQLIGFLENNQAISHNLISQSLADNSDKYIQSYGQDLGILLNESNNEIILSTGSTISIDIETNTDNYAVVFDNEIIDVKPTGLKKQLQTYDNPIKNCLSILRSGQSRGDGIYRINPTGNEFEEFDVYCDMTTDGGGWTRIIYSDAQEFSIHTSVDTGGVGSYGKISDDDINKLIYPGVDMLLHYTNSSQFKINDLDSWTWDTMANDTIHVYDLGAEKLECIGTGESWNYTSGLNNSGWNTTMMKFNVPGYHLYFPTTSAYGYALRRGLDGSGGTICGLPEATTYVDSMIYLR